MIKILTTSLITLFTIISTIQLQANTTWVPIQVDSIMILVPYTPIEQFSAPNNLQVTTVNEVATLSWDNVEHASQYEIQFYDSQTNQWVSVGTTKELFFVLSGSYPSNTEFSVTACNYNSCTNSDGTSVGQTVSVVINISVPESPDDGTIGNVDEDANGIRDDVELEISAIYPDNAIKRGFLEHTAYYFRSFLLDDSIIDMRSHIAEVMKGYACLEGTNEGKDAYASIISTHLDSRERFGKYNENQQFLSQTSMSVGGLDCVLSGSGVEPISGCFFDEHKYSSIIGDNAIVTSNQILMGENIKITINVKNNIYLGKSFDFAYYLNDIEQEKRRINEGEETTWVIDSYLFENDGYLKLKLDNSNGLVWFDYSASCQPN